MDRDNLLLAMLLSKAGMGKGTAKPRISANPVSFDGVTSELPEYVYFTVTATGASLSYQWQYNAGLGWNDSPAEGNKTATLTVPVTEDRYGFQYRCKVTSGGVTVISAPATLEWHGVAVTSEMEAYTYIEDGGEATLSATVNALHYDGDATILWYFTDTMTPDAVLEEIHGQEVYGLEVTNETAAAGESVTTTLSIDLEKYAGDMNGKVIACRVTGDRTLRTQPPTKITVTEPEPEGGE